MSQRERRNRKDLAEAASARFAELTVLLEEQARSRVVRKLAVDDIRRIHGPLLAARADDAYDTYVADLAAKIAAFRDDPLTDQMMVLAEAAVYLNCAF